MKHIALLLGLFIAITFTSCSPAEVNDADTSDISEISFESELSILSHIEPEQSRLPSEEELESSQSDSHSESVAPVQSSQASESSDQISRVEETSQTNEGEVTFKLEQNDYTAPPPNVIQGTVTNNTSAEIPEFGIYVIEYFNGVSWELIIDGATTLELIYIQPGDSSTFYFGLYVNETDYPAGTYRVRLNGMGDLVDEFRIK